jgi:hypothetical protein
MSFGPSTPGGEITAADFPKGFLKSSTTPQTTPGTSSTTIVNQNTQFAPINITQANPGVLTLGGGGGGGIAITQTVQNTSNVSTQVSNTTTNSNYVSNQISNNVVNNNIVGSGSVGDTTQIPALTNTPTTSVTPSQTATQTATPTQTASAGSGGGNDWVTLILIGGIVIGALYFITKKKK